MFWKKPLGDDLLPLALLQILATTGGEGSVAQETWDKIVYIVQEAVRPKDESAEAVATESVQLVMTENGKLAVQSGDVDPLAGSVVMPTNQDGSGGPNVLELKALLAQRESEDTTSRASELDELKKTADQLRFVWLICCC